jgi:hypothetical protein
MQRTRQREPDEFLALGASELTGQSWIRMPGTGYKRTHHRPDDGRWKVQVKVQVKAEALKKIA